MLEKLKSGQNITCTVNKAPRAAAAVSTIARLMRLDPDSKRALRAAQRVRRQTTVVYNRGNRDWVQRRTCARVVRVSRGQTWTMPYSADLAADFRSVQDFLTIKPA